MDLINKLAVLRATLQAAATMGMGGDAFLGAAETIDEIMVQAEGELTALLARAEAAEARLALLESQAAELAEARGLLAEWKTAMPNGGNPADNCECCYCRRDAFLSRKEVKNG